jgi:hypothetical protein
VFVLGLAALEVDTLAFLASARAGCERDATAKNASKAQALSTVRIFILASTG